MYTQCSRCETWYRVGADQLRAARGRVRCSVCNETFDALARLTDELPTEDAPSDETAGPPIAETPAAGIHADPGPFGTALEDHAEPAPSRRMTMTWSLLCTLMALMLAGQVVYWNLDRWAQDPGFRPWLEAGCSRIPQTLPIACDLDPLVALDELALENYEFTNHPEIGQALYFTGLLVNRAELAQAYPLLYISMQNRWGETVAVGTFGPAEYLSEPVSGGQDIPPDSRVPIRLTLRDPGQEATGFRFDFRTRH